MEYTLSSVEKGCLPTQDEKALLSALWTGAQSYYLGAPVLEDVDRVCDDQSIADGTVTIAAQPDVPRNLTFAITDSNSSSSGVCTIVGKDMVGRAVSEVFTWVTSTGKSQTGVVIFASVTSVTLSGVSGSAGGSTDMINIGVGSVIGIPADIEDSDAVRYVNFGGARIASPTIAISEHKSGVNVSSSTYDGSKVLWVVVQPTRNVPNAD